VRGFFVAAPRDEFRSYRIATAWEHPPADVSEWDLGLHPGRLLPLAMAVSLASLWPYADSYGRKGSRTERTDDPVRRPLDARGFRLPRAENRTLTDVGGGV